MSLTFAQCVEYAAQLFNTIWDAFELPLWGVPIWMYMAAVILLAVSAAFLRFVFFNWLGQTVGEYNRSNRLAGGDKQK